MCTAFDNAALHDGLEPELGLQRSEPKVMDGQNKKNRNATLHDGLEPEQGLTTLAKVIITKCHKPIPITTEQLLHRSAT